MLYDRPNIRSGNLGCDTKTRYESNTNLASIGIGPNRYRSKLGQNPLKRKVDGSGSDRSD